MSAQGKLIRAKGAGVGIILLVMFFLFNGSAHAAQVVVNASVLNIRAGPGTQYKVLDQIDKGTSYQVLGRSGDWYKISLPGGGSGWVAGWLVDVKETPSGVNNQTGTAVQAGGGTGKQAVVKASILNVRHSPSTGAAIIGHVKEGEKLPVTGTSGDWYQVRLPGGGSGWVAGWLVDIKQVSVPAGGKENGSGSDAKDTPKLVVVKESEINVRSAPGSGTAVVGRVKQGDRLPVIDVSGDWYKVRLPGSGSGWVASKLVEAASEDMERPSPAAAVARADNVNLRGGPGITHEILTRVNRGEKMQILEETGDWYKVQLSRGSIGWIARSLVDVDKAGAAEPRELVIGHETPDEEQDEDRTSGPHLEKLALKEVDGRTLVTLTATAAMEHNIFTLTAPNRLVVDIKGVKPGQIPEEIDVDSKLVSRIRSGWLSKEPDVARLVFDVKDAVLFNTNQSDSGKQLALDIYLPELNECLAGKVVAIDPGHGGHDPGAKGPSGLVEKDVNLEVALLAAHLLEQKGARVVLTRSSDKFVGLEERTGIAQRAGADIFVSIHMNANHSSYKQGTSTYYRRDNVTGFGVSQSDNRLLASRLQSSLVSALGRRDLGVQQANFVVLRTAVIPAVLLEVCFISNPAEEKLLRDEGFKAKIAEAIVKGIGNYFARKNS